MNNRAEKVYNLMKENHLHGEIIEEMENKIAVEICWGDWKHDHLRLKWLMEETFKDLKKVDSYTTEEDGSDCYSAIHYFYFN